MLAVENKKTRLYNFILGISVIFLDLQGLLFDVGGLVKNYLKLVLKWGNNKKLKKKKSQ